MKLKLFLYCIALSSCTAFYHGSLSESTINDNKYVADFARGYAKTTRFWGIGGFKRDALIADARKNLLLANPLKKGHRFANYTLDFKETIFFPGVHTTTVVITAEVISDTPSNFLNDLRNKNSVSDTTLIIGQTVYISEPKTYKRVKAKVLEVLKNEAVVGFEDHKGRFRIKKLDRLLIRTKPL